MNKLTLVCQTTFSAAHHLPGYHGSCAYVHGHTYGVDIEVSGFVGPVSGIMLDFHELERRVKLVLPDHRDLNDLFENPTAENIAPHLFGMIDDLLLDVGCQLESLTLWEGPGKGVRICR